MTFYRIKAKALVTQTSNARYGYKKYVKGRVYTIRRKLTPTQAKQVRSRKQLGVKVLSVRKIIKRR